MTSYLYKITYQQLPLWPGLPVSEMEIVATDVEHAVEEFGHMVIDPDSSDDDQYAIISVIRGEEYKVDYEELAKKQAELKANLSRRTRPAFCVMFHRWLVELTNYHRNLKSKLDPKAGTPDTFWGSTH